MKKDEQKNGVAQKGEALSDIAAAREHVSPEDQKLVELLRSSLDALDRVVPSAEPDPAVFAAQLEQQHRTMRKRFVRDLLLFLAVACSLLGVMGLMLFSVPSLFMAFYGAGFLLPLFLVLKEQERVSRG